MHQKIFINPRFKALKNSQKVLKTPVHALENSPKKSNFKDLQKLLTKVLQKGTIRGCQKILQKATTRGL